MALNAGDMLGPFKLLKELPPGGMGQVFIARDPAGNQVAIKICSSNDADMRKRFAREVRMMEGVNHPRVMPVLYSDVNYDPPFFVMPVALGSLEDELPVLSASEDKALQAFQEVCLGIQAVHNAGVIHRDVKPGNALRLRSGVIAVADLGLAKLVVRDSTILTHAKAIVGTEDYWAPEQKVEDGSRKADIRTDIYQLGRTLYRLLTGKSAAFVDVSLLSPGLARIVRKATRESPDERFQSVGELMDAISDYVASKDPNRNIVATIESKLLAVKERLRRGEYRETELAELLGLLLTATSISSETFVNLFDELPRDFLRLAATAAPGEFDDVLALYVSKLRDVVGGKSYSYAEEVAERMRLILSSTKSGMVAAESLRATLIAAWSLHRYTAMDTFDTMLRSVKDDAIAHDVAAMLSDELPLYRNMADRIPTDQLHPAIQVVQQRAVTTS